MSDGSLEASDFLEPSRGGEPRRRKYVYVPKNSPYYSMSSIGTILRSRLVMAQHLGRCLRPFEYVHHKDGDESNDSIDNLGLIDSDRHKIYVLLTRARHKDWQAGRSNIEPKYRECLLGEVARLRRVADHIRRHLQPLVETEWSDAWSGGKIIQ